MVNGEPLNLLEPSSLHLKIYEHIQLLGGNRFKDLNISVRIRGDDDRAQDLAINEAISKGINFYEKVRKEKQGPLQFRPKVYDDNDYFNWSDKDYELTEQDSHWLAKNFEALDNCLPD